MPRVLLVCDRPNWAYDAIARALVKHNARADLELDVSYLKGQERSLRRKSRSFDCVFPLGWQLLGELQGDRLRPRLKFLPPRKTVTGIHSHHSFDRRETRPDRSVQPPSALVTFLARFAGVNAVSRRLTELFRSAGLSGVVYTPNGVDTELFEPHEQIRSDGPLRVGFSGSSKHDWRKGVSEFIRPAAAAAGVELRLATPGDGSYVPLESMPRFYNEIDAYVCASSSEGFSLSVLEAAACGRPVISTRVGGCEDLIEDGVNGFLVDRTVEAIEQKLALLRDDRARARAMGEASRRVVEERWSWDKQAPAWLDFVAASIRQKG